MSTPAWQLAPAVEEDLNAASLQQPPMEDVQGAAPVQIPENGVTESRVESPEAANAPAWMKAPAVEAPAESSGPLTRAVKRIAVTSPKLAAAVVLDETATQIVTGLGAAAAGTVAGTVEAIKEGDLSRGVEEFHRVADKYTYQPRAEMSKKLSGAVAYPFEKAEELGAKAGEAVHEATKDPKAATVVHTAVAGVPYVAGYALGARRPRAAEETKPGAEPARAAEAPRVEPEWSKAEVVDQVTPKTSASAIDTAAHEAATSPLNKLPEPTEAMKRAGNYAKGHVTVNGLDISIENPKGSTRSGVDPDGKPWSRTMQSHYGYIKRTLAKDGDHVDVFLGPKAENPNLPVFVIDQVKPKTRAFDEVKTLIGFENEQAARAGYLANYQQGWQGIGKITATTLDDFKTWLKDGNTKKPFAPQARPEPAATRVTTLPPQETVAVERSAGAMEAEAITPQTRLGDAIDATMAPVRKAGKEIVDVTGGKSISYLDNLAKASPTAKKLRNTMEYTEFSKEPIEPSFYERTSLKTGEYVSRLENTLDTLRGSFRRKLPEDINVKLAAAMRGEKGTGISGETVLRLRGLLNDVRRYAKAQGLEVGFIKDYFPRVYKQRVLESDAGRTAFIKVLQKHGIEATEADTIAARIVNHDGIMLMERGPASERINPMKPQEAKPFELGRMLKQKARADKNLETARTLARIPDKELAPFLEDNVSAVLTRYITHAVRRAEYARAFGAGEGKLNRMVRDIITEAAQAGRPVRPAEVQRIYDLADAMQQKYRPIMSSTGRAANNFLISYQYLRTLPLATISSLSEPFLVVARGRPSVIPQAIARSLNHAIRETVRSVYRKFPKAEATKALEDVGLGLDAALSERLTASFGGEVTKFTTAFFKLNFLHQFTRFNRVLGNETGKLMVVRHLKDLKRGVPERRAAQLRRELAELGVDTDKGLSWIERGAKPNDPFYDTVKAAGLRFTNEVVMNPRPTNRPMWHSNPHFHLLAQLKGFQTVFGNTVLPRWYNMIAKRGAYEGTKNAAKIATAGVLMTFTAMLGNDLREVIKHGPGGNPKFKDEDPTKTVYRSMERAGFLGVFQFASDAMFAHRFGSPALAQLMGPQASQVNELIEGTGQAMEGKPRKLARGVVNAIPGANVIPSVRKDLTDAMVGESEQRGRRN